MANRLASETSPYLLQHANNPVEWYPWGPDALQKAQDEDKPIFLSIGYAACHWCHVMAHESFEDHDTAQIMNLNFINIKVDREERPDLDGIYMDAVVAMTGQGGWPLSAFLTPDGTPFLGGTYFPPERRFNLPSFKEVLVYIAQAWNSERTQLLQQADEVIKHLSHSFASSGTPEITKKLLDQAMLVLAQNYDWKNGGWGQAPKFPQPQSIEFLLRRATRGDKMALEMAEHGLQAMGAGGMYDVVGGGFARYSTDANWLVPHFEKMLYDNAQLGSNYLHAYLLTEKVKYRKICEETLNFVLREMTDIEGGFYSSLDADSDGEEGQYYVWSQNDIESILKPGTIADLFMQAYTVSETGNFEGQNVLQEKTSVSELAEMFQLSREDVKSSLALARELLLSARKLRIRPATDDKILTSWNGLMLATFAEAARFLNNDAYLAAARKNARFLLNHLHEPGRLLRSWRNGIAHLDGYLEDYACLVSGLLALYQADGDPEWYGTAHSLADEMLACFNDPQRGLFDTRHDHEDLIIRPKTLQDNALPSGSSMAALVLLQLSAFSGQYEYQQKALELFGLVQNALARYPTAFGTWLTAIDFYVGPIQEIAVLATGESDNQRPRMIEVVNQKYRPRSVLAVSSFPPASTAPALIQDRLLLEDRTTGFVCRNFTCQLPVNDPQLFAQQLDEPSKIKR